MGIQNKLHRGYKSEVLCPDAVRNPIYGTLPIEKLMKLQRLLLLFVSLFVAWQVNAAEFTSAKLTIVSPDGEMAFELPSTGFPVQDFTSFGQAPTLVVQSFEVNVTGALTEATLMVAMYETGSKPEEWIQIPLSDTGKGTWAATIDKDLVEIYQKEGEYTLEMYVKATDSDAKDVYFNNGGQNYKVMFALAAGSDEGGVKWLKNGTAELILYTGEYLQYRYDGDGTRDNTTMPGDVDQLGVNYFCLRYDLEENVNIVNASLQYMIYPANEQSGQWNTIECNELNTLVSSRTNTHRSSCNQPILISNNLEPGNYVLRLMYQLVDDNGKYYFFGRDNDNFVFYFSIKEPANPEILGISMIVTPTPGEQQYPWFEEGETYEVIDLTGEGGIESLTVDETYIFAQGNFDGISLAYKLINDGNEIYGDGIPMNLDGFGNWSNDNPSEVLRGDLLESGLTYTLQFWAEGVANGEMYYLNNGGQNYAVKFIYGTGGTPTVRGDLTGDNNVDVADLNKMIDMLIGKQPSDIPHGDLDGSGTIDVGDVSALIIIILGK